MYYLFVAVIMYAHFGYGQDCNAIDTTKCYLFKKYPTFSFAVEKKWESEEKTTESQTILIADTDGDCFPELITTGYQKLLNLNEILSNEIFIIDSKTHLIKGKLNTPYFSAVAGSSIVIGDIDNDGLNEIILAIADISLNAISLRGKLLCLDFQGNEKWVSDLKYGDNVLYKYGGSLSLADFNQDGNPEVYIFNEVFNAQNGIKLISGGSNGCGVSLESVNTGSLSLTYAANLDDNENDLELAAGYTIYKVKINNLFGISGNSMLPINIKINNQYKDGFCTVADINLDGILDVVVSHIDIANGSFVYAYSLISGLVNSIATSNIIGNDQLGAPFIGFIDKQLFPSIIVASNYKLNCFKFNGTPILNPEWKLNTSDGSGLISICSFNLNNEDLPKIIFRDEHYLKFVDAGSLPVIAIDSIKCFSRTALENPIISDFDNTGHAKVCIPCSESNDSPIGHLTIFGSPDSLPGWAPARSIWNQYNYNVLNINDDGSVPQFQKNNATYGNGKYNNFYVQESLLDSNGMYFAKAASLRGEVSCIDYNIDSNSYIVTFDILNDSKASLVVDSNLSVSFYSGNPETNGVLLGVYHTVNIIVPESSLNDLQFNIPATNLSKLFMVVNTDRTTSGLFSDSDFKLDECDFTDNIFQINVPSIDTISESICEGSSYNFYGDEITDDGTYSHKIKTANGCDSMVLFLNLTSVDTLHIFNEVTTCSAYTWNNQTFIESGIYTHQSASTQGCDSIVTLNLTINKEDNSSIYQTICDSYTWNGQTYTESGQYVYQTHNLYGCDSTITLNLLVHKSSFDIFEYNTCEPYTWNGKTYTDSGDYQYATTNEFGCDSIAELHLTIH
ncbi:MAG: hypothetical protein IT265_15850, partial [Saprospiraceae bacterium]|nr:hypothetical protein [Saprospiraceae bacterium]